MISRLLRRTRVMGVTTILLATAFAQEYRIDPDGGPLTLAEDVAAAVAVWNEAIEGRDPVDQEPGAEPEADRQPPLLRQDSNAPAVIGFGDPEKMGPDLVSATITTDEENALEIRLNPALYRDYPTALLHELGLLLGLPAVDQGVTELGVMSPSLGPNAPNAPTAQEIAALTAIDERAMGDLNGDGVVGLADLAELGRAYGQRGVNLPADLNRDGLVGAEDVEILREAYRFVTPEPEEGRADDEDAEPEESPADSEDAEPEESTIDSEDAEPEDSPADSEDAEPEDSPADSEDAQEAP